MGSPLKSFRGRARIVFKVGLPLKILEEKTFFSRQDDSCSSSHSLPNKGRLFLPLGLKRAGGLRVEQRVRRTQVRERASQRWSLREEDLPSLHLGLHQSHCSHCCRSPGW